MYNITLIPGDGIGPEVAYAAKKVIDSTGVKIDWDIQKAGAEAFEVHGTTLPEQLLESITKNKVALKGPITTPIASGFRSINVALRQHFDLYANIRPCKNFPGIQSRYENIDLIVVRENTEDLYCGKDYMVDDETAETIKVITKRGSERVARYAFKMAKMTNRKKATVVHKANIMKCTDGLFLKTVREVSEDFPEITFEEMIVDAMCMKLVQTPESFDVLVMPNLYGDIISDLCAGLVGGLGLIPSANIGESAAIFEPVHGSAPDIAGKGIANPTAAILSGCLMLKHLGEQSAAQAVEDAVNKVLAGRKGLTCDIGGNANTEEFTEEIVKNI